MTDQFTRREVNLALLAGALTLAGAAPGATSGPMAAQPPTVLFDFAIAGGWHHGLEDVAAALAIGERLRLCAEPQNPHDADAVAVHRADGLMLGYIPRSANAPIARLLERGATIEAVIVDRLQVRRSEDIPDDLAFTGFTNGDPRIRLVLVG
jgi:hypothetical protein